MDAVSSRDFLVECAAGFTNLMINLSRMAEELVIWSSSEFNFIELDDMYASTSSIMPQKKNPDTAELMRGKTGVAVGALMSLITICKGLPLSYNRDLQEATPNIWRSVETVRASVRVMKGMIKTMKIRLRCLLPSLSQVLRQLLNLQIPLSGKPEFLSGLLIRLLGCLQGKWKNLLWKKSIP